MSRDASDYKDDLITKKEIFSKFSISDASNVKVQVIPCCW